MDPLVQGLSSADLFEAVPDGVIVVDAEGVIRTLNHAAEQVFGYDRGELIGAPVEMLLREALREQHVRHRAGFQRNPHTRPMGLGLTLEGQRKDGTTFPLEISLVRTVGPIVVGEAGWTMATVRDVSERERVTDQLRQANLDLARAEERERIARDLHDTVIQHLFAVGMQLQALEVRLSDEELAGRVAWAVDHLDQTIREVRSVIFGLHSRLGPGGLRARLKELTEDASRSLGFEPRLVFDGLIDTSVSAELADHVLAVTREALSNVARHAKAGRAEVGVLVTDTQLAVRVTDDGVGIPDDYAHRGGTANLRERADLLGGDAVWSRRPEGGTLFEWRVPLDRNA